MIIAYFVLLMGVYFLANTLGWILIQLFIIKRVEINIPVIIGGLMFTLFDINGLYVKGKIKRYFSDAQW